MESVKVMKPRKKTKELSQIRQVKGEMTTVIKCHMEYCIAKQKLAKLHSVVPPCKI